MKRTILAALALAAALPACFYVENPVDGGLTSFEVTTSQIAKISGSTQTAAEVVSSCEKKYAPAAVPTNVRGTKECPYKMPVGDVSITVAVKALDQAGNLLNTLNKNVSMRVVPGDLTGTDYTTRTVQLTKGVGTAKVRAAHMFGTVRVWVEDAPPVPIYSGGQISGNPPTEIRGSRTYATGISNPIYFEEPTLASVQTPDTRDNRSSPLVNQFLLIGKNPDAGEGKLFQSCKDDPENDGKETAMVVTATDNAGFFVTDLTACRIKEDVTNGSPTNPVQQFEPEPDGFYPGTFGSIYVYNYSYPDGLWRGDLLFTVSGSVQEFTSTTQLTFAAWTIADKVRLRPENEWNMYLGRLTPKEINARTCGQRRTTDDVADVLCGFQTYNLKLESLESTLVKIRNVRFPNTFAKCDLNGDGQVTFFCANSGAFSECGAPINDTEPEEMACNIACSTSSKRVSPKGVTYDFTGTRCTDDASFDGFNQFVVELPGFGPKEAALDDSLDLGNGPTRYELVNVSGTSAASTTDYANGAQVALWCDTDVHYKLGSAAVVATTSDPVLAAGQVQYEFVNGFGNGRVAFLAVNPAVTGARCSVGKSVRTRILVTTHDAVPTLNLKCDVNDPDEEKARECQNLRGATFDIVGHLRHVQPARPRWMVLPRDEDDLCCRPGPGLSCPKPIKPCP